MRKTRPVFIHCSIDKGDLAAHQKRVREALETVSSCEECQQVQSEANYLGYNDWHEAARMMQQSGQRQKWCKLCCKYRFPYEQCPVFQAGRR